MEVRLIDALLQSSVNESVKRFFESKREKIIFGAGNQARICCDILKQLEVKVKYLMVSDKGVSACLVGENIFTYKIGDIPERDKVECDVLIAVNESLNGEIQKILKAQGFQNVYWSDSWNAFNEAARSIIFNKYLKERVDGFDPNSEIIEYGGFRILGCKGQPVTYTSMLMGEFNDIIAPSIFGDYKKLTEGPYEWGEVKLEKEDIVFDLGANIGMFSCVAASKGCQVYAFEPTPSTIDLLRKNQALYGKFQIASYAVCDKVGKEKFYYNNNLKDDVDTGRNSLFQRKNLKYETVEVNTITIDEFVRRNQLERVNFIKADIEGAEREMLRGARETLGKFAPKLALCTYHLPDDKEVMERLILEANPNYVIEHKWEKLYGYVPR